MTHRWRVMAWMIVMIVLLAWTALPVAVDSAAASTQAPRLWQLAEQEQATLEQRGVVLHESSLSTYLNTVAERLWEKVDTDLNLPTVEVIMDSRMEAYAYPNGYCYLSTGILDQIENEDQLAMILAHEMVHYVRQHAVALYNHFQKPIFNAALQYANQNQGFNEQAMNKEIQAAEYEADHEGLAILKAAGYCEAEVLALMSNLMRGLRDQGPPEASGPLENRIKIMQRLIGHARSDFSCKSATDGDPQHFLKRIAPAFLANAQTSLRRGNWNQADKSVTKFLVLQPENARAFYLKGEILRRRNDGDGKNLCIGCYEKALKIDPTFPLAHRALGELYYKAGRYQMARPYFEAFLSLAPQDDAREYVKGYLRQCRD